MDALQFLLDEIKQLQLLGLAYRAHRRGTRASLTPAQVLTELRIRPDEYRAVVQRLWIDGLLERHDGDVQVLRLTPAGTRLIQARGRTDVAPQTA